MLYMKRFYFIFLLIGLLGGTVQAQIPQAPQSLPSPNVANLGLYGEIPVSCFTGIPDVSIPLYEVTVGDFHVPFSLSYHAAGIRPDQHPGWTGVGWNLNAGGVLSRIVKGFPDELNVKNYPGLEEKGYYFHSGILDTPTWNTSDYLETTIERFGDFDIEPDEFNFSFLNYQGKFMMNSDKTWMVQCDKPIKVDFSGTWMKVPFNHAYTAFEYSGYSPSFDGFTLTAEDGTQYVFGKEQNAIEYSISFFNQSTDFWTATAWHLTKILLANGQEITYSYTRGDFINQMDISLNDDLGSYTYGGGFLSPECESSSHSSIGASYEGSLISPVYLDHISFPECDVTFSRYETTELRYPRDIYEFKYGIWQRNPHYRFVNFLADNPIDDNYPACLNKLKWYKLNNLEIKDKKGKWIRDFNFTYTNDPSQRLMLKSISEFVWGIKGRNYEMKYNSPELLPVYLAGKVDHWGFFNNRLMTENYETHYASREPNDQVLTYGVLDKLYYPTGGYTRFEFESHKYCKQVKVNRWEGCDESLTSKTAGGLRIKKIINSVTGEEADEKLDKEYFYVSDYMTRKDKANVSSGVLGGQFKYYFDDYHVRGKSDKNLKRIIKRFSSQSVLPACINSSGCHIGYSEVIEKRIDGSFTRYQYTNFDNGHLDDAPNALIYPNRLPYQPYASREIERGCLLHKTEYSADNTIKSEIQMTYERSPEQYVKSMKVSTARFCPSSVVYYIDGCAYKEYLYNYRTKNLVETNHDNPLAPVNIQTDYEYDQYGLIKETKTTVNGGIQKLVHKRPYDFTSKVCTEMVNNHVLSPVVQELKYFIPEGKSPQKLREINYEYTKMGGTSSITIFPCTAIWQRVGDGPLKETYHCMDYDGYKHPLYVIRGGEKTVYLWGYNYQHLVAEIKGVTLQEVETAIGDLLSFMQAETPDFSKLTLLKTSLPQAQITSYTYQPMVGTTSMTNPRGISVYYEYDLLQRLKNQKDNNQKVEKKYDYQYSLDLQ